MTYSIEQASGEHLRFIPAIELAAASMFPEEDLPRSLRYRVTDNVVLRQACEARKLWVALTGDGQAVGYAMTDTMDGHAHLHEMDVHPSHARQGLGTRLLAAAMEKARLDEFSHISLVTFRHLPWNAPFYEKRGFSTLPLQKQGPQLRALLAEESDAGLNGLNRIAMWTEL